MRYSKLAKKCESLEKDSQNYQLKIKELEEENEKLKSEKQQLNAELSHERQRHSLYKQEVDIVKKNEAINLVEMRNKIHLQVCEGLKLSTSCFPTLNDPVGKKLASVVCDSDFEDDFSDSELEDDEEEEIDNSEKDGSKNVEENEEEENEETDDEETEDEERENINLPKE